MEIPVRLARYPGADFPRNSVAMAAVASRGLLIGTWAYGLCDQRTFCPLRFFSGFQTRWAHGLKVYVPMFQHWQRVTATATLQPFNA
jgi:hypothetical protein